MILIPIILIFVIIIARIQRGMFVALLLVVATKSIFDAYWEYRIGPLSFSSFGGILIPILFYPVLIKTKELPKFWLQRSKLIFLALSFGLLWAFPIKPMETMEIFLVNINILLGFYIIPILIDTKEKLRLLLIAIMIAGVFPVAVSIFQFQTGIIFQERETVGLTRYVGFYHDGFPVRFYGLFTLFSLLTYLSIFKIKSNFFLIRSVLLSVGALFSVFLVFSKAGVAILIIWLLMIISQSRDRFKIGMYFVIGFSILFLIFGDFLFSSVEQLFGKEIGYQEGQVKDARYTLAGRGYIWEHYWQFWSTEQSFFFQWFGDGLIRPVHNDYLKNLLTNGIIGVLLSIAFLFSMFKLVLNSSRKVYLFCFMLLSMYVIDGTGLETSLYYYYNILLWGFIGIFTTKKPYYLK